MEKLRTTILQVVLTGFVVTVFFVLLKRGALRISESLKSLSPLFLGVTAFIFILLAIAALPDLLGPFREISRKQCIALALILLVGFALTCFSAPRTHRIYYDENIYLHIGQSIAQGGKAQMVNYGEIKYGEFIVHQGEYNKQPNGYPFLLSVAFRVFGCHEIVAFLLNNLIFVVSAFLVFLIAFLLSRDYILSYYAALAYIVIPQNILWHNTTSVEPASTLCILMSVFFILVFLRVQKIIVLYLAVVTACAASQFRMESLLIFPMLACLLLLKNLRLIRDRRIYYAIPLTLLLILPHMLHICAFSGHPWGASQEKLSLAYIGHNFVTNGLFFVNNRDFPAIIAFFAMLAFVSKGRLHDKAKLLIWFLLFWGVFLFFYAGSYYYGADMRFSLMSFPPLCVLSAIGLAWMENQINNKIKRRIPIGLVILTVCLLSFLPKARIEGQEAWAARYDHHYAKKMLEHLPKDSVIFTHNPNMFLFWGRSSAQASILAGQDQNGLKGLSLNYPGGIYFHYNFWCSVNDEAQKNFCRSILNKFPHREIIQFQERDYKYILYEILVDNP